MSDGTTPPPPSPLSSVKHYRVNPERSAFTFPAKHPVLSPENDSQGTDTIACSCPAVPCTHTSPFAIVTPAITPRKFQTRAPGRAESQPGRYSGQDDRKKKKEKKGEKKKKGKAPNYYSLVSCLTFRQVAFTVYFHHFMYRAKRLEKYVYLSPPPFLRLPSPFS